ncbi:MAG: response regulator [bacterium]
MGYHVLIADDDSNLLNMVKEYLGYRGFRVSAVSDGMQLLAAVQNMKPDLVITDMNMPSLDGAQAFEKMVDSKERAGIPVIIWSGVEVEKGRKLASANEKVRFIKKPISMSDLENIIDEMLGSSIILDYDSVPSPGRSESALLAVDIAVNFHTAIRERLSSRGFSVYTAFDSSEAAQKTGERKPDVLVIGPGQGLNTGLTVLEQVRKKAGSPVPAVFVYNPLDRQALENFAEDPSVILLQSPAPAAEIEKAVKRITGKI